MGTKAYVGGVRAELTATPVMLSPNGGSGDVHLVLENPSCYPVNVEVVNLKTFDPTIAGTKGPLLRAAVRVGGYVAGVSKKGTAQQKVGAWVPVARGQTELLAIVVGTMSGIVLRRIRLRS